MVNLPDDSIAAKIAERSVLLKVRTAVGIEGQGVWVQSIAAGVMRAHSAW